MSRMIALMLALVPLTGACSAAVAQNGDHSAHHGAHQHAAFESGRLHVRVDGEEGLPDLVLIPGLSSSPEIWQPTVDALKGRYRIHRIHVSGFAGSPAGDNAQNGQTPMPVAAPVAEEIARYIREQNLNKPAVIGHSMGGTIGMMLSARHPDLVGKLMVVDMVPFAGAMFGGTDATVAAVTPVADQIWTTQAKLPRAAYVMAATQTINGMINTQSRREEALQHMRDSDQGVSAAAFRELIVTDLRPELGQITAPTTVLYVKFNDARMTNEVTDAIYAASFANKPGVTLKRIDDSAHFIMFDQPQRFAIEIDTFLKSN
ncbi:alpha/beta fold hydrolase [Brevundimonas sp.]|uniref:alpha/beta fold hydrolase n=1 Tax=Brevundimonas sp. TaxID=1871086 RepID=UPI002FC9D0AA